MALTNRTVDLWVDELWDGMIGYSLDSATYELSDGRQIKLEIVQDDIGLEEFDFYGEIKPYTQNVYTGRSARPDGFNGAARKIDTRDGFVWWQPPADVLNSPETVETLRKLVQGWYHEDWYYVGIVVQIDNACFKCGKLSNAGMASLWGIESNSGNDFMKETIKELIWEAWRA